MRSAKEYASTITTASLAVTMITAAFIVASSTTATASPHVVTPLPAAYASVGNPRAVPQPDSHLTSDIAQVPPSYTVASGDTLSAIAQTHLTGVATWIDLWHANLGTVPDPDLIHPGLALTLPSGPVAGPAQPVRIVNTANVTPTVAPKPGPRPFHARLVTHPTPAAHVNVGGYSGFQACVIKRESGGNPQVMNASRHYGLYQFSFSTWVRNGGNPATFGHASITEQNQVFATAMSKPGGANNWAPYDGC